jgi:hypothetical protein
MFSLGFRGLIILRLFFKTISHTVFNFCTNYLRGSSLAQQISYFSCLMNKRLQLSLRRMVAQACANITFESATYPHSTVNLLLWVILYETNSTSVINSVSFRL